MIEVTETETRKGVNTGIGILATGAAVALLYFGRAFFITISVAVIIAFLLDPAVVLFMRLRIPRGLSSFIVCAISLVLIYLAGVGLYMQGVQISDALPAYGQRISELVDAAAGRMDRIEGKLYESLVPKRFQDVPPPPPETGNRGRKRAATKAAQPEAPAPPVVQEVRIQPASTSLIRYVYDYLREFYSTLLMASFVPFLVYFLLSWRDHLRARFLMLYHGDPRQEAAQAWEGVGTMVRAYVIGNFMLGILLTICSALLFAALQVPYWLLVSPISGFLSLVPYVGLPFAIAPPLIAILPVTRQPSVYFFLIISISVLHVLALNLMYPKLVGARVHLNPLAVTIALMFWGMLWGGIGLVLAIPITASFKAVCDHVERLRPYARLLGD